MSSDDIETTRTPSEESDGSSISGLEEMSLFDDNATMNTTRSFAIKVIKFESPPRKKRKPKAVVGQPVVLKEQPAMEVIDEDEAKDNSWQLSKRQKIIIGVLSVALVAGIAMAVVMGVSGSDESQPTSANTVSGQGTETSSTTGGSPTTTPAPTLSPVDAIDPTLPPATSGPSDEPSTDFPTFPSSTEPEVIPTTPSSAGASGGDSGGPSLSFSLAPSYADALSEAPTSLSSLKPTSTPTMEPSREPTPAPALVEGPSTPTPLPSPQPTPLPTLRPTVAPTPPTPQPSPRPTPSPTTAAPTPLPTLRPTPQPTTASPTFPPTPRPTSSPTMTPMPDSSVTFCAIADVPYNPKQASDIVRQIRNLNSDCEFLIHLGDIKDGDDPCVEGVYGGFRNTMRLSNVVGLVVPGDNEWDDCKERNFDEAFTHFSNYFIGMESYWNGKYDFSIRRDPSDPVNFHFVKKRSVFLGLNLIGQTKIFNREDWNARMSSFSRYAQGVIRKAAQSEGVRSVVILSHPNPKNQDLDLFFDPIIRMISREFNDEISMLYLHGDGHDWNFDTNWKGKTNLLRVQHEGGSNAPPLMVTVDPIAGGGVARSTFQFDRRNG